MHLCDWLLNIGMHKMNFIYLWIILVPVVLICFVSGQIVDMAIQMKALLLGAAMAAVGCTTIIALVLSLANHQTLDQPYSTQVQISSSVS